MSVSPRLIFCTLTLLAAVPACHAQQMAALPEEHAEAVLSTVATMPDAPSTTLGMQQTPQQGSSSSTPSQAQQPADQKSTEEQQREEGAREVEQQTKQRMLGIVPAFNEVIGGTAVPLTAGQKFHLFFVSSIDPYQFVIAGIDSGIEQWQDEYPEYHYGIQGYARRYAASFFDNWDGNFWGNAVLPSVLHQDPRYFRLGPGHSAMHRILYTASTAFRCKGDNGKWEPNYSNVLGNFIGGAISNLYYPQEDRGAVLTIERGFTVTIEGIAGALAEEFYPDYESYRQRAKARKAARMAAAQGVTPQGAAGTAPPAPANEKTGP